MSRAGRGLKGEDSLPALARTTPLHHSSQIRRRATQPPDRRSQSHGSPANAFLSTPAFPDVEQTKRSFAWHPPSTDKGGGRRHAIHSPFSYPYFPHRKSSSSSSSSPPVQGVKERERDKRCLDIVDINLLATGSTTGSVVAALRVAVLVELEGAVAVFGAAKGVGLVDLGGLGQLAVGFEGAGFVGCVLEANGGARGSQCRVVCMGEAGEGGGGGRAYITSPLSSW